MNTKSWISFHSYIPNFYIAENNFFYSGLNEGCDLLAVAISEIPTPSTTTTTTTGINCSLGGYASELPVPVSTTTTTTLISSTTTSTSSTTTTTTTFFPGSYVLDLQGFQNFAVDLNTIYILNSYNLNTVFVNTEIIPGSLST
jgi:hypothetical protein